MGAQKNRYRETESAAEQRGWPNAAVWALWPWLAWGLPVLLFVLIAAGGSGGWEMLIALFLSPLLLPVMALVNLAPRMVMRRGNGLRSSTTPVSIAMIVHWWSLSLVALSHRDAGDSGRVDSWLGERFFEVGEPLEGVLFAVGLMMLVVSYVVALVFAVGPGGEARTGDDAVDPGDRGSAGQTGEGSAPAAPRPRFRWEPSPRWVVVAAVLVPVLAVAGVWGGVALGERTASRTADAQEARWAEMQQQLSPVRAAVSDTGWFLEYGGVREGPESWKSGTDTATVVTEWRYTTDEPVEVVLERVRAAFEADGWRLAPIPVDAETELAEESLPGSRVEFTATGEDGFEFALAVDSRELFAAEVPPNSVETRVVLQAEGPTESVPDDLWIDWRERLTPEERNTEIDPARAWEGVEIRSYRADEWPSLALAASTMFR